MEMTSGKNLVWDMNLGTKTMEVAWFSMVGRRQFPLTNQGKGRVCFEKDNYDFKKAEPLTYRFVFLLIYHYLIIAVL
jgi:hypothetical protein